MLKYILVFTLLFVSSMNVFSATYGYTSNASTNTVTGGGLEWMQWDETIGMSVNAAIAQYSGDGWRIATQSEMATLFNTFKFGEADGFIFDSFKDTSQTATFINQPSEASDSNDFIDLFGVTAANPIGTEDDPWRKSEALFGGFGECCSRARVIDDWTSLTMGPRPGRADMGRATYGASPEQGIALVRLSAVPIPAAIWLFSSGLIGLMGIARRKKS